MYVCAGADVIGMIHNTYTYTYNSIKMYDPWIGMTPFIYCSNNMAVQMGHTFLAVTNLVDFSVVLRCRIRNYFGLKVVSRS